VRRPPIAARRTSARRSTLSTLGVTRARKRHCQYPARGAAHHGREQPDTAAPTCGDSNRGHSSCRAWADSSGHSNTWWICGIRQ
jgi:hypothetical protein